MQVGARDLLDARHLLALDRAELGEVDLGPGEQIDAAAGRRRGSRLGRCGRSSRRAALGERLDVLAQDAAVLAAALDLAEVDAALACQLAHGGAGIGEREDAFVDRCSGAGGGWRNRW